MIAEATSTDLKDALTEHLEVTKTQASRLEQIFESSGEKAKAEKCKGMQGVIQEGSDLIREIKDENVRDAAIIASAQRVEHYEMAGYGTARNYANLLEDENAAQLLQETLDEEKEADAKLTALAEDINVSAPIGNESETPARSKKRVA
jgi:ferritin-like metal-binding protein YciE